MSIPIEQDAVVSRYLEAVGTGDRKRYAISLEELQRIIAASHSINVARMDLLTALQRSVPSTGNTETSTSSPQTFDAELKDALTNVIIMQTRVNEREQSFHKLLAQAIEQRTVDAVPVEPGHVEDWAKAVLEAARQID